MEVSEVLGQTLDVLVVGAGLSGLATAWYLHADGHAVLVCEAEARGGGTITSRPVEGFLCEGGPNGFQKTPALGALIAELGLEERLRTADVRLPRYIWWEGRLRSVPLTAGQLLFSDLLSWVGKARLVYELTVPRLTEAREETIAEFVYRRFGEEVLNRLVEPFVSGNYAGDVGQLSVEATLGDLVTFERTSGSVLREVLVHRSGTSASSLCTFEAGLEELPEALARRLGGRVWTECPLVRLEQTAEGWLAVVRRQGDEMVLTARSVLLSVPAHAAAQIVGSFDSELSRSLNSIYYPPVAVVSLGYPTTQLPQPLEGFGHLIPRSQALRTLGGIWNCSLFPRRAPAGWRQYTCFVGGTTDMASANLDDDELVGLVHRDLQTVLGIQGTHRLLRLTRWPRAIPQYALGHAAKQVRIEALLDRWPGLFLAGSYFGGISIEAGIARATARCAALHTYLADPAVQAILRPT